MADSMTMTRICVASSVAAPFFIWRSPVAQKKRSSRSAPIRVVLLAIPMLVAAPSAADIASATTAVRAGNDIVLSGSSIRAVPHALISSGTCSTAPCWLAVNTKSPMILNADGSGDARYSVRSYRLWYGKAMTQRQNADLVAEDILQTVPSAE